MIALLTILTTLGAVAGVLGALRLVVRLNSSRTIRTGYSAMRAARDVTLLVLGSLAGMIVVGQVLAG